MRSRICFASRQFSIASLNASYCCWDNVTETVLAWTLRVHW
jgi:hypothetical protein